MLGNRIQQTSTTPGTGTYSLTGTVANRNPFIGTPPNGFATGKQCYYLAEENGVGWELGIGTVTDLATDTLSRDTIIGSSNGGLAVNWGAGTRQISSAPLSELLGAMGGRLIKGTVGGTANAITVTTPVPLRALTDGALVQFDPTADSSAAVTLNVDGTGAVALKDSVGGAFDSVKILKAAQTCLASYKSSTGFWYLLSALQPTVDATTAVKGIVQLADAAAMEAATAGRAVTADVQHRHAGHAKATLSWNFASILTDYGVTSVADDGVGLWTPTFDTAFSAANAYLHAHSHVESVGNATGHYEKMISKTTTTCAHRFNVNGTATDIDQVHTAYFGDQ